MFDKREAEAEANRANVMADAFQREARLAAAVITKDPFQTSAETVVRANIRNNWMLNGRVCTCSIRVATTRSPMTWYHDMTPDLPRDRLLLQLAYLQKYGVPPLAPADYLARNGLLLAADEDSEQQGAVQLFGAGRGPRAETALSPSSSLTPFPRTLSGFSGGPGSVSDASERSYATSLSQSEAGQSARRKKTLVRTAGTARAADSIVGCDEETPIAMPLSVTIR